MLLLVHARCYQCRHVSMRLDVATSARLCNEEMIIAVAITRARVLLVLVAARAMNTR